MQQGAGGLLRGGRSNNGESGTEKKGSTKTTEGCLRNPKNTWEENGEK